MRVAMRTDASSRIGTGHVIRCLTLADLLREAGADVTFVCRDGDGAMIKYVEKRGYPVLSLPSFAFDQETDAEQTAALLAGRRMDWLVVDHYDLDARWEMRLSNTVPKILVIDDLANRPHHCDVLLDQNAIRSDGRESGGYGGLVPKTCRLLFGLRYLLIRRPFAEQRRFVRMRSGSVSRLLVGYGGSDPTGETRKVLEALCHSDCGRLQVDVVIGQANREAAAIHQLCGKSGHTLHVQTEDMSKLMAKADLAFGGGGISLWERCLLGLPSLVTVVADNQAANVKLAADFGAVRNLGCHADMTVSGYWSALEEALRSPERLMEMSQRSLELTEPVWDGKGIHPVVHAMLQA